MAAKDADVAKHLSFEDVSMHSPGVFSRFEAQRAREQPTLANLRRVLAEVGHATEHHERILSSAVDKADGLGDADLKRLKYVVTNLKGGVLELSAHARFVDAVNENLSPEEVYAQFDGDQLSEAVKKQKAEIDALRTELEAQIGALSEQVGDFESEFARTAAQLAAAESGACPSGLAPLSEDVDADDVDDGMESARVALEAADAELAAAQAAVAERRREASEAERSLGPDEAALAATLAQVEALEDAAGAGAKGAHLALQSESAAQYTSELCALLRGLSGVELVAARGESLLLRLAEHTLTLRLEAGSTALRDAELQPPTVAVEDVVAHAGRRVDVAVREVQARLAAAGHVC